MTCQTQILVEVGVPANVVVTVKGIGVPGPAGTTDHGLLDGLTDDDHQQYHTDARGDARYYGKAAVDNALGLKADKDTTYTRTETDNRIQAVVGAAPAALDTLVELATQLQADESAASALGVTVANQAAQIAGKETAGVAATLDAAHTAAADPHAQYHNNTRGDARYPQLSAFSAWVQSNLLGLASAAALRTLIALTNATTSGRLARFTDTAGTIGQTTSLYEDTTTGNVGVGNTGPAAKLHVTGDVRLDGNVAMGGTAIQADNVLTISANVTDPTSGKNGIISARSLNMTANNSWPLTGVSGSTNVITGAFTASGIHKGLAGSAIINTAGTLSDGRGVEGVIYNTSTGTITNGYTFRGQIQNLNAAGKITNAYGCHVSVAFNNGASGSGGDITNTYGFYVADITSGRQTNQAYAFYNSDANARSYFAGNTGFGDATAPTTIIDSSGPIRARPYTVGTLPSASAVGAGSETHVTDANTAYAAGLGTIVAGGGANFVRVTSNGTNWIIM